jgi:hypothetical protein
MGAARCLLHISSPLNGLKLISTNEMTPTCVLDQYNTTVMGINIVSRPLEMIV